MSTKKERAEIISRISGEMADSGKYLNYQQIEWALRAMGYSEARSQLDNRVVRQLLNEACERARNTNPT